MNNGWTGGQYSIFRVILGISVCAWSVATILPLQSAASESSSEWRILTALLTIIPALSVLLAVGWRDQMAAALIAILSMFFLKDFPSLATRQLFPLAFLLVFHASLPPAPYGSLAARGRLDPGNGWEFRPAIYSMGWLWLVALHLFRPPMYAEIVAVILVLLLIMTLVPRWALWCWCGLFLILIGRIAVEPRVEYALSIFLFQLFTFDPAWIPPLPLSSTSKRTEREQEAVYVSRETQAAPSSPSPLPVTTDTGDENNKPEHIFYDGHCGLCHRCVRFVLAEDREGKTFRFAPLDSDAFRAAVTEEERKNLPDTIVVRTADGRTLIQSQAVLYIMQRLGGLWRLIATLVLVIPAGLLNTVYAGVARIRRHVFAAPAEACPILPKHLRGRFDF
jgi:predicted DCC family thiol-disulfide oxidoreductase YuxK